MNDCVYYLHYKLSVVFLLELEVNIFGLNPEIFDLLGLQIVADFDVVAEDKVVGFIVSAVDFIDNVVHPGSSSCNWRLGIVICQIDENAIDYDLNFRD